MEGSGQRPSAMGRNQGYLVSETDFPTVAAVDANFLVANVATGTSEDDRDKLRYFLARAAKTHAVIVIPMPAFAEYLVKADQAGLESLEQLERKRHVRLAPFDRAAAFECAQMNAAALGRGSKRDGSSDHWQKVKIDRQIVAIAKATGAQLIVSSDQDLRSNAARIGMRCCTIQDLPLPDDARQGKLELTDEAEEKSSA